MTVIEDALRSGRQSLTEYESKQFLATFGISACLETLVSDAELATAAAEAIGYPVVLKVCGATLSHKTEVGGVALNLRTAQEVHHEAERLLRIPGCEGLLVEEMVKGDRELVCGLVRDPQLGPCVMFGLGGIFAEALDDAVFRVAPLSKNEAIEMMLQIRGAKVLAEFRGQAQVNMEAMAGILVALGRVGAECETIQAIDINPVKIRRDGTPVVVDALITLVAAKAQPALNPATTESRVESSARHPLFPFLEPESVAIVGASASPGKAGYELVRNILANEFRGKIYPVNPKGGDILGLRAYQKVSDLPSDLGIVILPAAGTAQALRDLTAKGVRNVVLLAGGFAEVDEAGASIQQELVDIIRTTGVRVLGPNTSGHTSTPHCFTSAFFPLGKIRRGSVSVIAQTGNFATHTMRHILADEHFGVCRVLGIGNKIDIDETDALELLASDPETRSIVMYLESFKRPRRFLEVAREVTRRKPLVMLKTGTSETGRQAAIAHTAAMASEDRLIDGMLRQAGVVRIANYTDLILSVKALSMLPLPAGNGVSFLAPSGAMLVSLTDLCCRLDLSVPTLSPATVNRLQEISPAYLRMRNPVDIWGSAGVHGVEFAYREGMEAALKDPAVDAVASVFMLTRANGVPSSYQFVLDLVEKYPKKPILISFSAENECAEECRAFLEPRGVPTFSEIEHPFEALSILMRCQRAMNRPQDEAVATTAGR